jgi:hypothetical protein
MRDGINFTVSTAGRRRLCDIVSNSPESEKVCLARPHCFGLGPSSIMAATGKSQTCVWRWQERFKAHGLCGC